MAGITDYIPDIGISKSSVVSFIAWFLIIVIVLVVVGVVTWILIRRMKFKYKVVVFENVAGRYEPTRKDSAMELRFGAGGDSVFYIRKHKKYQPMPRIQVGRKTYWFAIREDGEWINIGIENIDEKSREMKINFLDKEMRYARTSLQKSLKDRYNKPGFMEKYGGIIAYVSLIAITGIMMWLLFDKFLDITGNITSNLEMMNQLQSIEKDILSSLNNICTGSGITK